MRGVRILALDLLHEPVGQQPGDRPIQGARGQPDPAVGGLLGELHYGVPVCLARGEREQDQEPGLAPGACPGEANDRGH